jgi:hypothetical protein
MTDVEDVVEFNLCKCCQCEQKDYCNDYECTCGELECENDGEDEDWVVEDELCQCVYCKSARGEFSEEETEIGLVEYYADLIENIQCSCGCQLRNTLYKLVQECVAMGYEEASEKMRKFIDE